MKNILILLSVAALPLLSGCEDFFDTKPEDIIDNKDYISAQNEIYTGFYGILNKIQDMADHAIYLTDTRGNYLEPTATTPAELMDIYNYGNLQGNSYADPSCYYALIIACNDYMHKMAEYKINVEGALGTAEDNWKALVSSAIRTKAWTYMKLAQIYGKAIWFSDPMVEMKDLSGHEFEHLTTIHAIIDKCITLLESGETTIQGIEGINGQITMNWENYFDPEGQSTSYDLWNYVSPEPTLLSCELLLWSSNPDYALIREKLLNHLHLSFNSSSEDIPYLLNAARKSEYGQGRHFANTAHFNEYETVCSAMYSYFQNQTNRLAEHFSNKYPNQYYLKPAAFGYSKYKNGDNRFPINCSVSQNDTVMSKYMYGVTEYSTYQSEASIPLQRGHDYHYFLAEAENNLGHWDEAETILNQGFANRWPGGIDTTDIDVRYNGWPTTVAIGNIGTRKNDGNLGLSGFHSGRSHPYGRVDEDGTIYICNTTGSGGMRDDLLAAENADVIAYLEENKIPYMLSSEPEAEQRIILPDENARRKFFDMQLLDEMLLEYVGEGRTYGMMTRMALKYNDPSIIANRVCPKYPESMREDIRNKIMAGQYFVDWKL